MTDELERARRQRMALVALAVLAAVLAAAACSGGGGAAEVTTAGELTELTPREAASVEGFRRTTSRLARELAVGQVTGRPEGAPAARREMRARLEEVIALARAKPQARYLGLTMRQSIAFAAGYFSHLDEELVDELTATAATLP